jgi:hypothetical protein
MKEKTSKIISILSVAPMIALYVVTAIYFHDKSLFDGAAWYCILIGFLTILPLSAYFLEHILPSFKDQGRKGERELAFIMCVTGYVLGTLLSFIFKAPRAVKLIFSSYLVTGGVLAVINGLMKFKASGHACGAAGPYLVLLYYLGPKVWYAILILIPVFWARMAMGRHTLKELAYGALEGMSATALTLLIFTVI